MCGITGILDFSSQSSMEHLQDMTHVLEHRGPDASGEFYENEDGFVIGLGHRRLSIIDTTSVANQPMFYKDLCIVYNGEVYNYSEIKEELLLLGHQFKTDSDTEVILHAYDQWGDDCVRKFIGMFAFCVYNKSSKSFKIFRDRPGVKPLYYYWDGSLFLFGSELKTFHQHPKFGKELDLTQVKKFIQYGYIPTPYSIYKNVKKLEAGSILEVSISEKKYTTKKYWDVKSFYSKPKRTIDLQSAIQETETLLKSACDYRMVADVPVGVFLSGGYDSSLTTALLQTSTSKKIKTFTIGVKDETINEANFAKEISTYLGTEHNELYIDEKQMLEMVEELPYYFDEPFGDSSSIPTMLLSRFAKKQVTVALSADGGDEVFGGYNRYDYLKQLRRLKLLKQLPLPYQFLTSRFISEEEKAKRLQVLLKNPTAIQMADILNTSLPVDRIDVLFKEKVSNVDTILMLENLSNIKGDLSKMMAYDYETYLQDDILPKVDRATMSASLEGREPLLDHRLLEYAATLPDNFKYNKGSKKFILKQITHKYLPKEMMERPKMGFAIPMKQWLKQELKDKIEYYLGEPFVAKQGIFNHSQLTQLKEEIVSGTNKHYQSLWYLLSFQMWYEKWQS